MWIWSSGPQSPAKVVPTDRIGYIHTNISHFFWSPMGSLRVGHDWATSLSLFTFMHWRRKWQPHSSVLAWRIPGTGEPGGLLSTGSHRVGHDWSDLAAAAYSQERKQMVSCIKTPADYPMQCQENTAQILRGSHTIHSVLSALIRLRSCLFR